MKAQLLRSLLLAGLMATAGPNVFAQDWPQWRCVGQD